MTTHRPVALRLDFRSGLPIYIQIMDQIQSQVVGGLLKPGTQLPTVRALAQELRVNFNTVARAYRLLDEAHIISTQQGRGTYVLSKPPPEVEKRLRDENLEALTHRYIREALRLNFTSREIIQMTRVQLRSWKETGDRDTE
jgi:GntR family transcriptional regulator